MGLINLSRVSIPCVGIYSIVDSSTIDSCGVTYSSSLIVSSLIFPLSYVLME